jgi:acyl carrier protein
VTQRDDLTRIVRAAVEGCSLPAPDIGDPDAGQTPLSTRFDELGFDSVAFMEFCIAIHVDTGVELTVEQVTALGSPMAVVDFLGRDR